jgi:hypothetical protein
MVRPIAALLLLTLALPGALASQAAPRATPLAAGARVRITRPGEQPLVAIVVAHTADSLLVQASGHSLPVALPLTEISQLDVSTGRHRHVAKGIGVGFVAGGTVGALLGAATYQPCTSTEFLGCLMAPENRGQSAALGILVGGGLGLIVGGLVGSVRQEQWARVPLDGKRVSLSVSPSARGTGLGMTLQF